MVQMEEDIDGYINNLEQTTKDLISARNHAEQMDQAANVDPLTKVRNKRSYDIESERLASEGKFACEIITAVRAAESHREPPYAEDDIRWKYPECIIESDTELAEKRINWKVSSIKEEIDNLKKSGKEHDELLDQLAKDLEYLLVLKSKCTGI